MPNPDVLDLLRARLAETSRFDNRKLPPERQLAAECGVSRARIRKALAVLAEEGQVNRHVGRGTFVQFGDEATTIDIADIAEHTGPREAMQARMVLEPYLASLAAINASTKQVAGLWELSRQMRSSASWAEYEVYDAKFHRLIAECSGNNLLASVHEIVNRVRRMVVWGWLDTRPSGPPENYSSFAEHDAICTAIAQRSRNAAAEAMQLHLRTTNGKLIGSQD